MRRRRTAIFFLVLGICLSALAVTLNITWVVLNLREVVLLVLGIIFFALIITGLIFNTIFLVREIRRNEQHDAFLNAVTHELKTPIASIKLYLETLKSRKLDDAKRDEFYDIMLADNDRLLGTVEQVLQASRTRDKGRPVDMEPLDLRPIIEEAASTLLSQRHLDDSSVRLTLPAEPVMIRGDRREITTAISNLLDNAVKYSADVPKIAIRLKPVARSRAEIYIRDNGIGILPGDLKRIFKRFYRVPNRAIGAVKGTGLGLPIVRSIIEKHGGRIRAESRGENKGATFVIRLPRL